MGKVQTHLDSRYETTIGGMQSVSDKCEAGIGGVRVCVPVAPRRVCGRKILAVRDRLADATEGVGRAPLDDAEYFLRGDENNYTGKSCETNVAAGAIGHDSGEYAAMEGVGDAVHGQEL